MSLLFPFSFVLGFTNRNDISRAVAVQHQLYQRGFTCSPLIYTSLQNSTYPYCRAVKVWLDFLISWWSRLMAVYVYALCLLLLAYFIVSIVSGGNSLVYAIKVLLFILTRKSISHICYTIATINSSECEQQHGRLKHRSLSISL
jgi:hypothetical protein